MAQDSAVLIKVQNDLKQLAQLVESAFPRDENGDIDYQGHRSFHKNESDSIKQYKESKAAIIKNILTWASIGLLTVIVSNLPDLHLLKVLQDLLFKWSH